MSRSTRTRLTALLLALAPACGSPPADGRGPDIVLIWVDDLGFGDVGYNDSELATPRIDELARSGLVLNRFYASPMCTPSRAQLLTGRHAAHFGLHANVNKGESQGLPPDAVTLPELLAEAGYATHLVGKWHLGHERAEHHPQRHGFEHFYGHLGGWVDYSTHERDGELDWQRDGVAIEERGYATELFAAEAIRVIQGHDFAARPLFLELAFNAPHTPLNQAPGSELTAVGSDERRLYRTMVASLDEAIGRVLGALERAGRRDDCLVVFASDNGGSLHYGARNAPLRDGKFTTYEGGLRVPAVLSWPNHIAPGGVSDVPATNLDLLPSLAALAGVPDSSRPAGLDGRDLSAHWTGGPALEREPLYFAIRQRRHIRSAVLDGHDKLVRERSPEGELREELYDVFADPGERIDVSAERPERLRALRASLDAFEERFAGDGL